MNATNFYRRNGKPLNLGAAPLKALVWVLLCTVPATVIAVEKHDDQSATPASAAKGVIYPQMNRKLGVEGEVLLQYSVGRDGKAFDIRVLGQADPSFIASAISSLRSSQFPVPTVDGQIVELKDKKRRYKFELSNLPQPEKSNEELAIANRKDQLASAGAGVTKPVLANR